MVARGLGGYKDVAKLLNALRRLVRHGDLEFGKNGWDDLCAALARACWQTTVIGPIGPQERQGDGWEAAVPLAETDGLPGRDAVACLEKIVRSVSPTHRPHQIWRAAGLIGLVFVLSEPCVIRRVYHAFGQQIPLNSGAALQIYIVFRDRQPLL